MKQWLKRAATVSIAALLLASFAGCGGDAKKATEKTEGYPVSWTQTLNGQETTASVEKAPSRAISMSQATTEMMLALGLEDKMVGTNSVRQGQSAVGKVAVLRNFHGGKA